MNTPVASSIAVLEMTTDTPLCGLGIGVITGVQDHQLNITENRLDRVIIGTAFWQRDPMEF